MVNADSVNSGDLMLSLGYPSELEKAREGGLQIARRTQAAGQGNNRAIEPKRTEAYDTKREICNVASSSLGNLATLRAVGFKPTNPSAGVVGHLWIRSRPGTGPRAASRE